MDLDLIAVVARSLERVIAVLFGGLSIYYGFRLFLVVPTETRADGEIRLPGISVILSKAGPGIFFSAFGAAIVITSLLQAVKVGEDYAGMIATAEPLATVSRPPQDVDQQDTARAKLAIQTLNCLTRSITQGPAAAIASDSELAIREAKLTLMKDVWDSRSWGDQSSFRKWATGQSASVARPAQNFFAAERSDCPYRE